MGLSDLTIRLIVLFLPGVIAAIIVDELTEHEVWTPFKFVLYSIVLGFISYLVYQLLFMLLILVCPQLSGNSVHFWQSLFDKDSNIALNEVVYACIVSIFIGGIISTIIQRKILHKVARWLSISQKYGDENLLTYFLNSQEVTWVCVRDYEKKLIYEGWVQSFSEISSLREIVLVDVKVYYLEAEETEEATKPAYEVSKIYLAIPNNATIETT